MSTFGSFNTVRLGIYASQKGLDVTGNNITNINTNGYTRQRLEQTSLVTTASDRYYSRYKTRVGQGVLTTGVTQLRDPGLDISFRKAQADLGSADGKLAGLEDLARILDEVGKGDGEQDDGVILNQMNDLRDLISGAITNGISEYDPLIRESATALTAYFRDYAAQLEQMVDKYETRLNDQVDTVNDILAGIQKLNVSIRNADIRGDEALELRDQRNLLLDELSQYVKIDVKYSMEDVGAGLQVERLTVSLATGDKNTLVDGEYATQLSLSSPQQNPDYPAVDPDNPYLDKDGNPTANVSDANMIENPNYGITLEPMKDLDGALEDPTDVYGTNLGDTDLYGALQSTREMLTEKGEFATDRASLEQALTDNVDEVNALLTKIADAATSTDDRNKAVEELKTYMNVTVNDGPPYTVTTASGVNLVNGNTAATLAAPQDASGEYSITVNGAPLPAGDLSTGTLGDTLGAANSPPDLELDADASIKRGIPYYQMTLDSLAREFAEQMNELNSTGLAGGGALFSTSSSNNTTAGITAANISVSKDWAEGKVSFQATADPNAPSGDTSNLAKFLDLFNREDISFDPGDINSGATGSPYKGSFEDMLLRIQSTLAEDQKTTTSLLTNYTVTQNEIYTDRDSVMGVDLNDEATSLMTYQKAYTAACRLMTVLEQALDSLINGTV